MREAIIRLKNREIVKTLEAAKSVVWFIVKKNECTGQLCKTKRHERPQKAKLFLTSQHTEIKNSLEEAAVSLSKSRIKSLQQGATIDYTQYQEVQN